ncbi:MAG: hypothetical protein HZA78_10070 [Candidatus Schekmanbacteria bacterium]|nr:hypothetical protein [Candidatus Schekmanbacteria bacterium]
MKKGQVIKLILVIILLLSLPAYVYSLRVPDPELAKKENPHWNGKSCLICHEEEPKKDQKATFKFGADFVKLCNSCHDTSLSRVEEHLVDVKINTDNARFKMPPADFPLPDGKISCITCHDLRLQEQNNLKVKENNPMFLRRYPSEIMQTFEWADSEIDERYRQSRYAMCLNCHVQGSVMAWSPHKNQIKPNGEINEELCLFCHYEVPDRNIIDRKDWKIRGSLQFQCKNCHMGKTRFHPIRVTHYGNVPPPKIDSQIKSTERVIGLLIPLDKDEQGVERLTCSSCHNAHQKGVLKNETTIKGSDEPNRLRLPGYNICLGCHGEAVGVPQGGRPF